MYNEVKNENDNLKNEIKIIKIEYEEEKNKFNEKTKVYENIIKNNEEDYDNILCKLAEYCCVNCGCLVNGLDNVKGTLKDSIVGNMGCSSSMVGIMKNNGKNSRCVMMNRDEINDMVVNLKVERENYKLLLKTEWRVRRNII